MDGESKAQDISESDCLNSWKVIASYLGRSVRTVRRWEEQEGLPVHRHKHDRGSTVSAYKSELDVWLERRQSSEISEPLSAESEVKRRHWYFGFAAMATFVLVMMSILVGLHYLDKNDGQHLDKNDGQHLDKNDGQQSELVGEMTHKHATKLDWVLVTRVNNQTDLQVFDEPFKHVLEQAVSNTQIADLASEKRTSEILKLMRKPSDTQIDSLLGQEIGLRDERIRIVLTGRVDRFGPDLLISVDFICPDRGVVTASLSEQISDGDPILPAVYRLSERAGDKIDEMLSSIEHDRIALKDVTTSSITALRRYSVAEALMEGDNMSAAIELLQQALQEDPEFATAYAQLAWALYEQGWPEDEYLPQIERALQHLLEISDKERYFISASHHHLTGDLRRAQSLYKTVLILEPKHYWANKYAYALCQQLHKRLGCNEYKLRLAEMRPSSFVWNYKAAWTLVGKTGDPSNAQPYLARAAENLSTEIYRVHPEAAVNVELYEVYRQWVSGDLPQVLKDEDLIANLYSSRASNIQDLILRELGLVSLAFGKLEKAESLFLSISNYRIRHELLARLLFSRWDDEAMKRHLIKNSFYQDPFTAILMTRVGLQNMATTLVEDLERQGVPPAQLKIIKGKLALDRGQRQEAISLLNDGIDEIVHPAHGLFFAGADILAGAWSKQGDPGKAVQVLQRTSRRRNQAAFSGTADLWVRCQLRLAQIYKRIGRRAEVAEIKAQLQQAMAHADTDHPLLGKLRQL